MVDVLIVDDEPTVRRFAARVLTEAGYGVHEATDGEEALDLIYGRATPPDVVLSDVMMPRINGIELLRALSASHPGLPVILMSGYATPQLTDLGTAPPCGVLAKPFPRERLVEEVRRCIEGQDPTTASDPAVPSV